MDAEPSEIVVGPQPAGPLRLVHLAPADQPGSVSELAQRLFPAYEVEGGTAHLAGCMLEDRPVLRMLFRRAGQSRELFLDDEGQPLPAAARAALGVDEVAPMKRPPKVDPEQLARLIEAGWELARAEHPASGGHAGEAELELAEMELVWCKYARGKLRFTLGEQSVDLPFAGWARSLEPPAFVCPYTGTASRHLAATDDGRVSVAEEVARCSVTGRRVLRDELGRCSVTGEPALPEFLVPCPVSGEWVLREKLVACSECEEQASPAAVEQGMCRACRTREPVGALDARLQRILAEHPSLEGWRRWKMAESGSVYNLEAQGLLERMVVVVDKESLEIRRLRRQSRLEPLAGLVRRWKR